MTNLTHSAQDFKTKAAEKLFNNNKTKITNKLREGKRYVYEITNGSRSYILKGFKLNIPTLDPEDHKPRENFIEFVASIMEACQEFTFSKFLSTLNSHFAKPLILDYDIALPDIELSYPFLFLEVIFEHGGQCLNRIEEMDVGLVYNLMRQSASAFSLLHAIGVMHFDIKPENMVYDQEEDLLKVIDMGSTFGSNTTRSVYKPTLDLDGKLKSHTPIYSAPEVLQYLEGTSAANSFILGSIDTYAWAMSFYSLLLNKDQDALEVEIEKFKLKDENSYSKFLLQLKSRLGGMQPAMGEEQKKFKVIARELLTGLSFRPEKRPKMDDIIDRMKKFEKVENVVIPYKKIEQRRLQRVLKILKLEGESCTGSDTIEVADVDPYEDYLSKTVGAYQGFIDRRKTKAELKCENKMNEISIVPPEDKNDDFVNLKEDHEEDELYEEEKDQITLTCCKSVFSKDEYRKQLIHVNTCLIPLKKVHKYSVTIDCVCGKKINRLDLNNYFSSSTINELFEEIRSINERRKSLAANTDYICKEEIDKGLDSQCECGIETNTMYLGSKTCNSKAPQTIPFRKGTVMPCCMKNVQDKYVLMSELIELAKKKNVGHLERVICPFCSKTLNRASMKLLFTEEEVKLILKRSSGSENKSPQKTTLVVVDVKI